MKLFILSVSLAFLPAFIMGQNLVLNPSFEDTSFCPSTLDQLNAATGWRSYSGTCDYMNTCSFSMFCTVPSNFFGYQQPSSGKAYASFYAYFTSYPNYREFPGSVLSAPLVKGNKYFISFRVALANSHDYSRPCNNIGMKFTSNDYWTGWPAPVNNSAHVYSAAVISDTANWTTIKGSFIADSAYTRVMIGNFFNDSNSTSIGDPTQYGAYFFLDDVCVSADSAYCYGWSGVEDDEARLTARVYPNPFSGVVTIALPVETGDAVLFIYNTLGVEVVTLPFRGKEVSVPRGDLVNGMYYFRISGGQGIVYTGKLLVEP